MAHPRRIAPYNADCDTEKESHICAHISMADDASEMAKHGGDAYLGLMGHKGLIADEPNCTIGDPADRAKKRSTLAVSYITGGGELPGTMGKVYPVGSFTGLTVLSVHPLDWAKETGHRPEQDLLSWWPGSNAASGRLTPFSALTERK
jgi:hypothetical protein